MISKLWYLITGAFASLYSCGVDPIALLDPYKCEYTGDNVCGSGKSILGCYNTVCKVPDDGKCPEYYVKKKLAAIPENECYYNYSGVVIL